MCYRPRHTSYHRALTVLTYSQFCIVVCLYWYQSHWWIKMNIFAPIYLVLKLLLNRPTTTKRRTDKKEKTGWNPRIQRKKQKTWHIAPASLTADHQQQNQQQQQIHPSIVCREIWCRDFTVLNEHAIRRRRSTTVTTMTDGYRSYLGPNVNQ